MAKTGAGHIATNAHELSIANMHAIIETKRPIVTPNGLKRTPNNGKLLLVVIISIVVVAAGDSKKVNGDDCFNSAASYVFHVDKARRSFKKITLFLLPMVGAVTSPIFSPFALHAIARKDAEQSIIARSM
jgi:hypothetical protein